MDREFDIIIIGGGATGLGAAVEAASRGYRAILFEGYDFGKGTSSKSTKLVHGGIRYLANLDFTLVHEGLSERFYFLNNAPHIAHAQGYLVPFYSFFDKAKYFAGINLYDLLAGSKKIGKSKFLNREEILKLAPDLKNSNLIGGAIYYDGQFDDTRMLISLLGTFIKHGGIAYNYHQVTGFIKDNNSKIIGVRVLDKLTNNQFEVFAKVVINATGTLTDSILDLDEPNETHSHVTAAQGAHLVFDKEVFKSDYALVIPKTSDGRVLFVLPWHNKVIVGTTDIAIDKAELDPDAKTSEIDFILETLNQYTIKKVTRKDIKSVFAGQRPLVKPAHQTNTAKISRKHEILYSDSGLISIVGGKWTIYRLMGEDTINFAVEKKLLPHTQSKTSTLHLSGYITAQAYEYPLSVYGSEAGKIKQIQEEINNFDKLHPNLPYLAAEVIYQLRYEMAKTIEDVLVRRTRAILLDASATKESAPYVAKLMAQELGKDATWVNDQITDFNQIADRYIIN